MALTIILSLLFSANADVSLLEFTDVVNSSELTPYDYFDPNEYQINPGDKIWIAFPGGLPFTGSDEAVSTVILSVSLDGILNIPTIPLIDTNFMTMQELQNTVQGFFAESFRGMIVSLGLARSAGFQIPITGQVKMPGFIVIDGLTRLSRALELAGGETQTGSLSNILVVDVLGDSSFYNLNNFIFNGDISSNPLVARNSRVHVFSVTSSIIIEGALAEVGEIQANKAFSSLTPNIRRIVEFIPGENAMHAIERVGGVSSLANLSDCFVERSVSDSSTYTIPFSLYDDSPVLFLQPGDRLVVPALPSYINVTGQVLLPAPIPYSSGMAATYYIGMAGGFNSLARQGSIRLINSNGEKIDIELNTIITPGATIEVPRVPVLFWEEYLTILTGVATVVIAYQSIFSN